MVVWRWFLICTVFSPRPTVQRSPLSSTVPRCVDSDTFASGVLRSTQHSSTFDEQQRTASIFHAGSFIIFNDTCPSRT